MEVKEAVATRTSIRKWQDKKIEREKLINILEAARRAPSWANTQPWRFIVIEDAESIEEVAKASGGQPVVATAPVVIICAGDFQAFSPGNIKKTIRELMTSGAFEITLTDEEIDALLAQESPAAPIGEEAMKTKTREQIQIAMAYMTLAAVDEGLGSCWIGGLDPGAVHEQFGLPPNILVHALLPIGYPAESPRPRPRKALEDIVRFGHRRQ